MKLGIAGVVLIVFLTLKLSNVIDWSWWWVLSPLWIGTALTLAGIAIFAVIGAVRRTRRRRTHEKQVRREDGWYR